MKVNLLKKLRRIGRESVTINSITKTDGIVTGIKISYSDSRYRGVSSFGQTEDEVKEAACKIYLQTEIDNIRKKYKKYSRKFKSQSK